MAKRKKITKSNYSNYFLRVLFISGIMLMFFAGVLNANASSSLHFDSDIATQEVDLTTQSPNRIIINSAQINLEVFQTVIENKKWEINENGASHLDTSANPGEGGNIIIYAHNTNDRFGKLHDVKKGDIIKVYSLDSKMYEYEVKNIIVVNSNQAEVLQPTKKEILTIYTCTGFADLKRLVIQAEPK